MSQGMEWTWIKIKGMPEVGLKVSYFVLPKPGSKKKKK